MFFLHLFFSYILLLQLAWAHLSIGQRSKKSNKSRLQKVKQVKAWNLSQCNENLIMKNGSLKILWKILINHNLLLKTAQLAFALQALIIPLLAPSGALIATPTYYWSPPHFFKSHRSSTLDFHFLSHYLYIKAIMLYKGNHWTRCAGFMVA